MCGPGIKHKVLNRWITRDKLKVRATRKEEQSKLEAGTRRIKKTRSMAKQKRATTVAEVARTPLLLDKINNEYMHV